ncbi:hypothetical protein B0H63DRAFT_453463 [Podospora didyma]|uniref:Uncharacterized protein n=1 Tax=Podospora didyma TaxID=330526 RepID=A0AAE0JZ61_9PEZI|nr:hypothetical protein B0H63DRAFT_456283 [Podospora didyma]KAK3366356.1 hypothetical protein B0H63DRAFT_456274 [Podospora didyma]KAK3372091.1 hypothetical protein B0H63DRAFT_453463 [Podospora didyma]
MAMYPSIERAADRESKIGNGDHDPKLQTIPDDIQVRVASAARTGFQIKYGFLRQMFQVNNLYHTLAGDSRSRAIDHVIRYAAEYNMDQFASKVVEKCLKIYQPCQRPTRELAKRKLRRPAGCSRWELTKGSASYWV